MPVTIGNSVCESQQRQQGFMAETLQARQPYFLLQGNLTRASVRRTNTMSVGCLNTFLRPAPLQYSTSLSLHKGFNFKGLPTPSFSEEENDNKTKMKR